LAREQAVTSFVAGFDTGPRSRMAEEMQSVPTCDAEGMDVPFQQRETSNLDLGMRTNPTYSLRAKIATAILFATAGIALLVVLVRSGHADSSAATFTQPQRDYSVMNTGSSNQWVEQPISQVPGTKEAQLSVKMVGSDIRGNHVVGHLVTLANPEGRVSLALPPGGCGTRELTTVTAKSHKPFCKLAINAGYFNVHTGACIGNVISDGRVVQTVPLTQGNVNFGIKDGKFYVGYFSPDDIGMMGFDHMVSGVVWLVRNGKNYVEQGWKEANITVQTSGDKYATNLASRTAVGFDAAGRLIIVQVDGSIAVGDNKRGMNMHMVADLLIKHGVVQAINLDGGGSSAMAENGVLINYPSDNQPPSCHKSGLYQCERPVSTVLCLHEEESVTVVPGSSGGGQTGGIVVAALLSIVAGAAFTFFAVRFLPCFDDDDYDKQISVDSSSPRTVAKQRKESFSQK